MHANKCIAKITNFATTISCFHDPFLPNAYVVKVDTLHLPELSPRHAKKCGMPPAEAANVFNVNARVHGFQKRISVEDFTPVDKNDITTTN
jgi:hypothetical protein